jgi:protein-tyrosine sulfotransferase
MASYKLLFLVSSFALNVLLISYHLFNHLQSTQLSFSLPAGNHDIAGSFSPSEKCSKQAVDPSHKPYIFIGGVPSSGTTLMRVILDAHPDVRCGGETRLIPRVLQMRERWRKGAKERRRLKEAGLTDSVLNIVVRNFISNIIELHGEPAKYLCNKDPMSLAQIKDLHAMFPRAKFLLMIRDGRAVAHSIVSRNITITSVDHKSYLSAAMFWNKIIDKMWTNCVKIGSNYCKIVFFENLVNQPKEQIKEILEYLEIPWHDNVLHHQLFIDKEVHLSKMEPSTRQVRKPITKETADKWKRMLTPVVKEQIWEHCPMLRKLGYKP